MQEFRGASTASGRLPGPSVPTRQRTPRPFRGSGRSEGEGGKGIYRQAFGHLTSMATSRHQKKIQSDFSRNGLAILVTPEQPSAGWAQEAAALV
ncbi:hypothetical protein JRQ81_008669 [Phrynocephalus forsythii]|uniref:Uncharacterized protein n=1 Tax=Phrynocephalus forsythii TaxID=171643 RepID=A0A9Q0XAN2_9SAUR|nr:hypothetical protein JRQ81_008669 [Phrynocephalus forsythii]